MYRRLLPCKTTTAADIECKLDDNVVSIIRHDHADDLFSLFYATEVFYVRRAVDPAVVFPSTNVSVSILLVCGHKYEAIG
jgi:hypothetical protein